MEAFKNGSFMGFDFNFGHLSFQQTGKILKGSLLNPYLNLVNTVEGNELQYNRRYKTKMKHPVLHGQKKSIFD